MDAKLKGKNLLVVPSVMLFDTFLQQSIRQLNECFYFYVALNLDLSNSLSGSERLVNILN